MSRSTPPSGVCVDANLVLRLLGLPDQPSARPLWARWTRQRRVIAAPFLLRYEVTNALHRYERAGILTIDDVRDATIRMLAIPLRYHTDDALHQEALNWAQRFALPAAYDAHYLALAHTLGFEFWTTDTRLARAVQSDLSWVHLVSP